MPSEALDIAYQARRRRLTAKVSAAAAYAWSQTFRDQQRAAAQTSAIVGAGQRQIVHLLDAYMAAKTVQATGAGSVKGLDPSRYVVGAIRAIGAAQVYQRPFIAYQRAVDDGRSHSAAVEAARASVTKLARTDLQLAQTHAARDWMADEETIVGWRRVLTGPGPHCALCTAASTRTYRKDDLAPIHESCSCTVEPLWGIEAVASVGTTVRVDNDPELGPRLMAEHWAPVGARIF